MIVVEDKKPNVFTAKIVLNGRITVPEEMRKIWKIEDGDYVEVQILTVRKNVED